MSEQASRRARHPARPRRTPRRRRRRCARPHRSRPRPPARSRRRPDSMRRGAATTARALAEQATCGRADFAQSAADLQRLVTTVDQGDERAGEGDERDRNGGGRHADAVGAGVACCPGTGASDARDDHGRAEHGQADQADHQGERASTRSPSAALLASVGEIRQITDRNASGVKQTRGGTDDLLRRAQALMRSSTDGSRASERPRAAHTRSDDRGLSRPKSAHGAPVQPVTTSASCQNGFHSGSSRPTSGWSCVRGIHWIGRGHGHPGGAQALQSAADRGHSRHRGARHSLALRRRSGARNRGGAGAGAASLSDCLRAARRRSAVSTACSSTSRSVRSVPMAGSSVSS